MKLIKTIQQERDSKTTKILNATFKNRCRGYADDCNIYVRTSKAGVCVRESITTFIDSLNIVMLTNIQTDCG